MDKLTRAGPGEFFELQCQSVVLATEPLVGNNVRGLDAAFATARDSAFL